MFKTIDGMPDDVLAIEAHGKVTHEDYVADLLPQFEFKLNQHKPLKVLYAISPDFEGFELAAMWDDTKYGIQHWNDVSHIAVVTDNVWVKNMTTMFAPFFPGQVRVYDCAELDQAKIWIAEPESLAA